MTKNIIIGSLFLVIGFFIAYAKIKATEAERAVVQSEQEIERLSLQLEKLNEETQIKGDFAHTVLIWLKEPENQEHRQKIEDGLNKLSAESEFIKSVHFGTPAGTDRPIVDNSYTYCYIVTFENAEAQDQYQVEPVHQEFLQNCKDLWSKVLIYDAIRMSE